MENTSQTEPLSRRDLYYYRRRFVTRVFTALAKHFATEAENHGATKSMIAKRLNVDPAQITRWLSAPSNLTLESISDILLALDAEAEPLTVVPFRERHTQNYAHPIIARAFNMWPEEKLQSTASSSEEARLPTFSASIPYTRVDSMAAAE